MAPVTVLAAILTAVVVAAGTPSVAAVAGPAVPAAGQHLRAVPPVQGRVLRTFSPPSTPYGAGHRGVDLAAVEGDPVRAALGGTVTFAGQVARVGWVTVDHGGGLRTTYGPLQPRAVRAGRLVAAGDRLGRLAAGARHLDWGARLGDAYIDPLGLLGPWQVHLVDPRRPAHDLAGAQALAAPPSGAAARPPGGVAGAAGLRWPVAGVVTSPFGLRVHPLTGQRRLHAGIDLAAPTGTAVTAPAGGRVTIAGVAGGYGLLVVLDHGGGVTTRYAHLSRLSVRPGQRVAAGAVLGAVGSTGLSSGAHLHFEVRRHGVAVDPLPWLRG